MLVCLRGKTVRIELVVGQAALRDEIAPGRLDHDRRPAGIDLVGGKIGQVRHHRLVDQAGAAPPVVPGRGLREHRHVAQVRQPRGGLLGPVVQVQVGPAAAAPVQHSRPRDGLELQVLDDRLDRREARAAGQQHDGLVAVLAQEEAAERPLQAQDLLLLHRREDVVGELAARHVADVQLDEGLVGLGVRRVGHRVAAPCTVAQDELDVLPGVVAQRVIGRQLHRQHGDVGRGALDRHHAAGHLAHRELARARYGARLDHEVGLRRGAAGEDQPGFLLGRRKRLGLVRAVDHAALEQTALAGAAGAVLAAVGQADALADGGHEDRFVAIDAEGPAAGLDGDGEGHDGTVDCARGADRARHCARDPISPDCAVLVPTSFPAADFGRPRLLIVGCGDVGLRVARLLRGRWRLFGLTSDPRRRAALRAAGIVPLVGNLDDAAALRRLAGLADAVLHLAPPPPQGAADARTAHLLQALARRGGPRCLVYASTSGVYGDCGGARFDETRAVAPATDRARRRVDAERQLRRHGRAFGTRVTILRIPGIYAADRPGGHPRERLARGTPVLAAADDVYTNHIHADDLARACVAALWRGRPQRVLHASDDTELKMGDYFERAAALCGLPAPPRIGRAEAAATLPPVLLSFMSESRRLDNTRLKRELRLRLRHPTIETGLLA
ncbi:MAG: NAD-dependent epimerase/dehydratase family protein [Piscinibacter sp.]|nr:NAD-dependent epimerase/dehydratase family protein [Piscinibacter sp.]